LVGLFDP